MHEAAQRAYRDPARRGEHWWFVGRRRILDHLLSRWLVEAPAPRRLVDIGPGYGVNSAVLQRHGELIAFDVDPASLAACRDLGVRRTALAALPRLPLRDRSVDLLTALDVLEHLDDDLAAMREFRRLLRPGGKLLLTVPALRILWGRQDLVSGHRRRYHRRAVLELCTAAGLRVERLSYFNFALFLPVLATRLFMRPFLGFANAESGSARSDFDVPAPFGLNRLLATVFAAERRFLVNRNFPWGVSLVCLASAADGNAGSCLAGADPRR